MQNEKLKISFCPELILTFAFLIYSIRNDFTGLAIAAFIDW